MHPLCSPRRASGGRDVVKRIGHDPNEIRLGGQGLFRLVVESAPNAFVMVDPGGVISLVNPQAEQLFGYRREELLGHPVELLVPERHRAQHIGQRSSFFAAPSKRAMGVGRDLYGLRKDGSEVPVEIGLTPIEMPEGLYVLAAIIDISERKRAERERRESEQRYAELVEQAADAIMVRRKSGEIMFVNDAACSMLGYSRIEFMRMSMMDLVDPSEQRSLEVVQGMKPLETQHFERRLRHKQGHWVPVETSAHRLGNGDIQNIFHDISERLQADEARRALPRQLLGAQEKERRRIARELHDEVGQVLTASQIKLQDLEELLKGARGSQEAAELSAMMAALLQQVRQLSLELRPSVLDDLGLAAAIRWFVRERIPQTRLKVELSASLDLPRATVELETALFRAFQSAVTNVLRHAEANTVSISLGHDADRLVLEVRDDGKGFDLDTARREAKRGGSLGLLGMEEWIRLSGGEILIESAPGKGTRILATVPLEGQAKKGG